jgi:XTP/dITP diphosphohydrolase
MSRATLYLASNNRHKAEELGAMLGDRFEVRLARELVPGITWNEDGETFLANASIKAQAVRAHTRSPVLADDSGLIVDVLGGAPGVHSSRYAGLDGDDAANNAKLLREVAGFPVAALTARFVCTLYFVDSQGKGHAFTGDCRGHIVRAARGAHGFGYDPLFEVAGTGRTMAELSAAEKNALSHRRAAFDAFRDWLDGGGS